jgi:hypothetical protein
MRTIQPCFVKISYSMVNPTFDIMTLKDLIVLMFANLGFAISTLYIMPPFVPNQYMLDRHQDKGEFDWEIYAWCVRDAMAKAGGFRLCEQSFREKVDYEKFMCRETDKLIY